LAFVRAGGRDAASESSPATNTSVQTNTISKSVPIKAFFGFAKDWIYWASIVIPILGILWSPLVDSVLMKGMTTSHGSIAKKNLGDIAKESLGGVFSGARQQECNDYA